MDNEKGLFVWDDEDDDLSEIFGEDERGEPVTSPTVFESEPELTRWQRILVVVGVVAVWVVTIGAIVLALRGGW